MEALPFFDGSDRRLFSLSVEEKGDHTQQGDENSRQADKAQDRQGGDRAGGKYHKNPSSTALAQTWEKSSVHPYHTRAEGGRQGGEGNR